jgi:hypothetical protein
MLRLVVIPDPPLFTSTHPFRSRATPTSWKPLPEPRNSSQRATALAELPYHLYRPRVSVAHNLGGQRR